MLASIVQQAYYRLGVPDTSSSGVVMGAGNFTFTTSGSVAYVPGQWVRMSLAADSSIYMDGIVTAYSAGSLSISVPNYPIVAVDVGAKTFTITGDCVDYLASVNAYAQGGEAFTIDGGPNHGYQVAKSAAFSGGQTIVTVGNTPGSGLSGGVIQTFSGSGIQTGWNILTLTATLNLPSAPTPGNDLLLIVEGRYAGDGSGGLPLYGYTTLTGLQALMPPFSNVKSFTTDTPTGAWFGRRTVQPGDGAAYTVSIRNTGEEPEVQTTHILILEIANVVAASAQVLYELGSYGSTDASGASQGTSDVRIVCALTGDGATIVLSGTGYSPLRYVYDRAVPGSFLCSVGIAHATDGQAPFTMTFGDAPVHGGENTQTGYQAWIAEYLAKTPTTTTVGTSQTPSLDGHSVTLTVTVAGSGGPPTGTVTLTDSLGSIAPQTLSLVGGVATYSTSALSIGIHTMGAAYNGDGAFATSSGNVVQEVDSLYPTFLAISSDYNPQFFGDEVTLTFAVTSSSGVPAGTVDVSDSIMGDLGPFPLIDGVVALVMDMAHPWAVDSHLFAAVYGGDGTHAGSSSGLVQLILTASGLFPLDLPGFAVMASYDEEGDVNLPPWASFSAVPSMASPLQPVYVLWTSVNVAKVRISGTNGIDTLDTGNLFTTGSGTYEVASGFHDTITLNCAAYDSSGNAVATQSLQVTVA